MNHVGNVCKIARLRAITGNREWFAREPLPKKHADDECIWTVRIESRTVHIEVPETYCLHPVRAVIHLTQRLAHQLLRRIRTHRLRRISFRQWQLLRITVDRA